MLFDMPMLGQFYYKILMVIFSLSFLLHCPANQPSKHILLLIYKYNIIKIDYIDLTNSHLTDQPFYFWPKFNSLLIGTASQDSTENIHRI